MSTYRLHYEKPLTPHETLCEASGEVPVIPDAKLLSRYRKRTRGDESTASPHPKGCKEKVGLVAPLCFFILSLALAGLSLCPNHQAVAGTIHAQPFYDETPCHQIYRAGWYLGKACAHARYNYGDDTGDRLVLSNLRKSARYLEQSRLSCNLFFTPGSRANALSRDLEHLAARLRKDPSPRTRQEIADILAGRFDDYARALPKATIGGGPPGYCLEKYFRTAFLLEYAFNALAYADNPEVGGRVRDHAVEDGFRVLSITLRELRALDDLNASTGRCADLSSIVPYVMKARRSTGNIRSAYILARDAARMALDLTQVRCP